MLSYLFYIIIVIICFLLSQIFRLYRWFKRTVASIQNNKWNVIKLILVPVLIYYLATRLLVIHQVYIKEDTYQYKEEDLTPRREERLKRYVRIEEKTLFLERYYNVLYALKSDDRPVLRRIFHIMTCNRRFYRFQELTWARALDSMCQKWDLEQFECYLKKCKFFSEKDKQKFINYFKLLEKDNSIE